MILLPAYPNVHFVFQGLVALRPWIMALPDIASIAAAIRPRITFTYLPIDQHPYILRDLVSIKL